MTATDDTAPPQPSGQSTASETSAHSSSNVVLMLASMVSGVVFGHFFPDMRDTMASFGKLFMALLQMCALPMVIVSVIVAPKRLMSANDTNSRAGRLLLLRFLSSLLLGVSIALVAGMVIRPGNGLDLVALDFIDRSYAGVQGGIEQGAAKDVDLVFFLIQVVPDNIFTALSAGNVASIMFFCLFAGAALTKVTRGAPQQYFFGLCDEIEKAISVLLSWFMRILPLGLFCLAGSQIQDFDSPIMHALRNFLLALTVCYLVMLSVYAVLFIRSSRTGLMAGLKEIGRPFLIAVGTQSSLASLPAIRETLGRQKRLRGDITSFSAAIGITLNPAGSVAFYALAALFLLQIYDVSLTPITLVILCLGTVLAGVAGVSVPGLAALNLLSIVAEPLALPHAPVVFLLTGIYPLLDSAMTGVNVAANTAISALLGKTQ
ncbi:dicarboxylate/amino acid:cation symporter [Desulfovibrio sp. OttesenSCG-928-G15]|nr:dicarboxylate/amino acid:cation symporter [Desulfovibrio sp. OttesenSCG-928-G15]